MIASIEWRNRIVNDPAMHHGDPSVASTHVTVTVIDGRGVRVNWSTGQSV